MLRPMSTTTNVKTRAKKWMSGLLRGAANDNDVGHKLNPTSSTLQYAELGLPQAFNLMSLAEDNRSNSAFVGGFDPALVRVDTSMTPGYSRPGPLPTPPRMSFPVAYERENRSKTMQYALSNQNNAIVHEASLGQPKLNTNLVPRPLSVDGRAETPTKPQKSKSPSGNQRLVQCAAFTKAGKRCTRQVKSEEPVEELSESGLDPLDRYCFQHVKEINSATGFYARKNGQWIEYKNWIPDHLLPETQASLRAEMEKARSNNDTPGYIYTFEIREPNSTTIKFKVGRATNHVRRLDQWGKQCGSKEQVRLGVYPEPDGGAASNLRGLQELDPTRTAAWCHRLERLVHLELADIVATKAYLDSGWPNPKALPDIYKAATRGVQSSDDPLGDKQACLDCGSVHKEIFEFERIKKGRYKGKEYELIVKPIVEKWGGFVDDFV